MPLSETTADDFLDCMVVLDNAETEVVSVASAVAVGAGTEVVIFIAVVAALLVVAVGMVVVTAGVVAAIDAPAVVAGVIPVDVIGYP